MGTLTTRLTPPRRKASEARQEASSGEPPALPAYARPWGVRGHLARRRPWGAPLRRRPHPDVADARGTHAPRVQLPAACPRKRSLDVEPATEPSVRGPREQSKWMRRETSTSWMQAARTESDRVGTMDSSSTGFRAGHRLRGRGQLSKQRMSKPDLPTSPSLPWAPAPITQSRLEASRAIPIAHRTSPSV